LSQLPAPPLGFISQSESRRFATGRGADTTAPAHSLPAQRESGRYITGHTLNVDGGFGATGLMFEFDPQKTRSLGAKGE
jgi:hypothetical protein